ncbi:hypothetical protein C1645_735159 [Glomus cerebriforme]|uniref:Wax synthase domain-containing protein n=1 Tax=Glomus cerebriforme TaxID=658196 RepID=A0A397TC77_9GLOM|nr:hypothetical protein C1645_735159 [Glomus cerebriforme]
MWLFIKHNRKYSPYTKINQGKEFTPFILTLYNWRHDSDIIPPSKSKIAGKEFEEPTITQVDEKIKSRVFIFIWKWMIHEIIIYLFAAFPQKIPERPYQIRVIEYFIKGIPAFTAVSMFHYICFFGFVFLYLSLNYDFTVILSLIALRCITTFSKTQSKDLEKHFLIKSGLLTPLQFSYINDYLITYSFNTKHCFNNPWISKNPREFWSVRWQNMFAEPFKELGYLPLKNLCINIGITSKKFCDAMGVLGAFLISSLLHEYLVIGLFNVITGEHLCFFMFHGLLLIIWEGIFGVERKDIMKESESEKEGYDFRNNVGVLLKWLLMLSIYILVLPAFIEPLTRRIDRWIIPSLFTDVNNIYG